MKVFKVFSNYSDDYEIRLLKMKLFATDEEDAKKTFINKCKENINKLRIFLKDHPELKYKELVIKIDHNYHSFESYYDLTYVNNEHNNTYEDYLGYGKESSFFTPSEKTEKNYKRYLEYNKYWNDAYEKLEKYKNNEERQKEYQDYVKNCVDEIAEMNKRLLSDDFIFDFFSKLEIQVREIKMNEFEIERIDRM